MKVYTLTFQNADNYGALLQAYALQRKIQEKYDTQILNYDNLHISDNYRLIVKRHKNPLKILYLFLRKLPFITKEIERGIEFDKFRKKLEVTSLCKNKQEIEKLIEKNSVLITGSDQIWNPQITGGIDDVYFLDLNIANVKKISYAASCGSTQNLKGHVGQIKSKLEKFNNISVRENSLKDFLNQECDTKAEVTSDPTILLKREDWEKLNLKDRIVNEKYIFSYSVGNVNQLYWDSLNELSECTGYAIVHFDKNPHDFKIKGKQISCYEKGPEEFLSLLANAEFAVVSSFHGLVLSTILNKNMFVILNSSPDRLLNFAQKTNLENRILKNVNDIKKVYAENIDWVAVNKILEKEREESTEWLFDAIEGEKNEQK